MATAANKQDEAKAEAEAKAKAKAVADAKVKAEKAKQAAQEEAAKTFAKLTEQDMESIKRGIDEIRSYANSSMNECIRLMNALTNYHYTAKDGRHRDKDQDKRVQEGANARGVASIQALKMYARRMEDELRGIQKTL